MRILQKIIGWISLILILGGAGLMAFKYLTNKTLFAALLATPVVQQSMGILKLMLYGAAAVLLGLILLTLSFKIGSSIRSKEKAEAKARKAVEKVQEQHAREAEDINARQAQEHADAEAEANRILGI